jgi:UDP:flavonoid glycosyltransferase YjiC (YdhE family)
MKTKFAQLPNVYVEGFLPYSEVFPYASIIVHQGGIGTLAEAIRAGVPSVVTPFCQDQYDNANRSAQLGISGWIPMENLSVNSLRKKLHAAARQKSSAIHLSNTIKQELETGALMKEINTFIGGITLCPYS